MSKSSILKKKMAYQMAKKKSKLGEGTRFKALVELLSARGAKTPKALAEWIGRKKYGKTKMAKLAAKGKK